MWAPTGGLLAHAGGLRLTSHKLRCLRIFLTSCSSSINEIIFIAPEHLGHTNGSIPPGRDKFFGLTEPNFGGNLWMTYQIQSRLELDHRCRLFSVSHETYLSKIHNSPAFRRDSPLLGMWVVNPAAGGTSPVLQRFGMFYRL